MSSAPLRREHAYQAVLEDIVAGRLSPGDRLTERALAKRLGISTTPVKEALRRLELEGFIQTMARRGILVAPNARVSVEDAVLVRASLEGLAAARAAQRIDEDGRSMLADAVARMRELTTDGRDHELIDANAEFHAAIRAASGNRYICSFVDSLLGVDAIVRRRALADAAESRRGLREHAAIAKAICRADDQTAERSMRAHVLRVGRFVIRSAATCPDVATPVRSRPQHGVLAGQDGYREPSSARKSATP